MKRILHRPNFGEPAHKRLAGLALLAGLGLLGGCSHPEAGRAGGQSSAPASSNTMPSQSPAPFRETLRVIIQFRGTGTGREPALLAGLSRQAQAPVRYVASVSPDTHVYRVEPAAGQRTDEVLARLRAMPGVAFAELDRPARAR